MKRYLAFKDMVHLRGAITRTANKINKESMMTKKRNYELNRLELLLCGFNKMCICTREYMDYEIKDTYGKYDIMNAVCYMSYGEKFLNQTKIDLIKKYNDDLLSNSFWKSEIYDDQSNLKHGEIFGKNVLFSFREIKRSNEMVALKAMMSIGTNREPILWEHWLRLKDGTILIPKETQEYFVLNGGIEEYIAKDPLRASYV